MILRILDAIGECLDRDSARRIARLNFDAEIRTELQKLMQKERRARLTLEEQGDLALLLSLDQFLEHLKRKARAVLRRPASSEARSRK